MANSPESRFLDATLPLCRLISAFLVVYTNLQCIIWPSQFHSTTVSLTRYHTYIFPMFLRDLLCWLPCIPLSPIQSSPRQMLLLLPVEILDVVFELIRRRDVYRVMKTCRRLRAIGERHLYSEVSLDGELRTALFFRTVTRHPVAARYVRCLAIRLRNPAEMVLATLGMENMSHLRQMCCTFREELPSEFGFHIPTEVQLESFETNCIDARWMADFLSTQPKLQDLALQLWTGPRSRSTGSVMSFFVAHAAPALHTLSCRIEDAHALVPGRPIARLHLLSSFHYLDQVRYLREMLSSVSSTLTSLWVGWPKWEGAPFVNVVSAVRRLENLTVQIEDQRFHAMNYIPDIASGLRQHSKLSAVVINKTPHGRDHYLLHTPVLQEDVQLQHDVLVHVLHPQVPSLRKVCLSQHCWSVTVHSDPDNPFFTEHPVEDNVWMYTEGDWIPADQSPYMAALWASGHSEYEVRRPTWKEVFREKYETREMQRNKMFAPLMFHTSISVHNERDGSPSEAL